MKLILKNFRCYTDKQFDFESNSGMVLLSGQSGVGKSTILLAINFVLYGEGKKLQTYGKKSCRVEIHFNDMKIVRTKCPNRLVLNNTHDVYEDASAQSIINKKFGKTFNVTGYISQNTLNSFVMMSPQEKLEFLESFAFSDIDIGKLKHKVKATIKKRDENLIRSESSLETAMEILKEIKNPKQILYPLKATKNKEIAIKNEKIRLKNVKTKIERMNRFLSSSKDRLSDLNILKAKTEMREKSLKSLSEKTNILSHAVAKLPVINKESIAEIKKKIKNIHKAKQLRESEIKYEENYSVFEKAIISEKEKLRNYKEKYKKIIWSEHGKEETDESIENLTLLCSDCRRVFGIRKQLESIEILNPIPIEEKNRIEADLIEKKKLLNKIELQSKSLKCPNCDVSLVIRDDSLVQIENLEITIDHDKENLKQEITDLSRRLGQVNKEISEYKLRTQRISDLENSIHEITSQYEMEFPKTKVDLRSIKDDLVYMKDYKQRQENIEYKLKENEKIETDISNEIYSDSLSSFFSDLKDQKKEIDQLREKCIHSDIDENDLISLEEKLRMHEEAIREKERLEKEIQENRIEMNNINSEIDSLEKEYRKKYKKINSKKFLEKKIEQEKIELKNLSLSQKIHEENMKKIFLYQNYLEEKKRFETANDRVKILLEESKENRKLKNSVLSLQRKIMESESKAILSIIDSINAHTQEYLDLFFVDPIIARLAPYKESKNSKKSQLNIQVEYKGMDGDRTMLSGGELSRVILAYTLALGEIFNTPMILLDECTSSLDQELTSTVISGIKSNYHNKLVIVIAHQCVSGIFDREICIS